MRRYYVFDEKLGKTVAKYCKAGEHTKLELEERRRMREIRMKNGQAR